MQPDHQRSYQTDEPGRVIYLGEVRRRQRARAGLPDRQYLAATLLVACGAWAIWLVVALTVPPARLLTYLAFLLPLAVAVSTTTTLLLYACEYRLIGFPDLRRCMRRGALVAAAVTANLAVLASGRWTLILMVVSAACVVLTDMAAEHRRG